MPRWSTNLSKFVYSIIVTWCLAFVLTVPTYVMASYVLTVITSASLAYLLHVTLEEPLIRIGRKLALRHSNQALAYARSAS